MATYVLGTHTSHDGSACLLKDGEILVAIEKERITRKKHDGGDDDNAAVLYCLAAAGIGIGDVDLVVQNANFHNFQHRPHLGRLIEHAKRVETVSHHLAHAYGALATAPFAGCDVMVIDGCGSPYSCCQDLANACIPAPPPEEFRHLAFEKDSYYAYDGCVLRPVYKDFSAWHEFGLPIAAPNTTRHSIGGAYFGISKYVFGGLEDPGKLMGLAPYGRPGRIDHALFDLRDGRVFVDYDWLPKFDRPALNREQLDRDFQYYADIAYWAQKEIERAVLYLLHHRHASRSSDNLCFSGGVALNAVANRLISQSGLYRQIHFNPPAGDNGIAVGCAYYGWHVLLGQARASRYRLPCYGISYPEQRILSAIARLGARLRHRRVEDRARAAAEALAAGKVIGWFQGGSEFGPRALGHRSILALPERAETRDFINRRIKFREDFRPFAPSVPYEEVATYFEQEDASPFMIQVSRARAEWREKLAAVVHVDGSARVQTVHAEFDPLFHRLHLRVQEATACAVLLNTSLNRRGMPIVETPTQALELFLETELDLLFIEDFVVEKTTPVAQTSG